MRYLFIALHVQICRQYNSITRYELIKPNFITNICNSYLFTLYTLSLTNNTKFTLVKYTEEIK